MTCPRLQAELDQLRHWTTHTTTQALHQWATDHARHCHHCTGWTPTPNLPRERQETR